MIKTLANGLLSRWRQAQLASRTQNLPRILLVAKTPAGRNRIRQWGQEWIVLRAQERIMPNTRRGPWLYVTAGRAESERWVHALDDVDFLVREREHKTDSHAKPASSRSLPIISYANCTRT